jgi:hypothetical protein
MLGSRSEFGLDAPPYPLAGLRNQQQRLAGFMKQIKEKDLEESTKKN